jgi:glycosyltransferase involved in cell wall biosynthesis
MEAINMFSLIIPVYKNSKSLEELISVLENLNDIFKNKIEIIFVIDGNPENEYEILKELLPNHKFKSQLIVHSKNFGSFAAIKTGLENATGDYFATLAADLQEPPELIEKIFKELPKNKSDIIIATRTSREDNLISKICSNAFWKFYKKNIIKDIPKGGVDLFGCNKKVRDSLISLKENNTSLIGLLFWVGFRRQFIGYKRNKRKYGKSAWNLKKKFKYMTDSIFAFSDIPIKVLVILGVIGISISFLLSMLVLISKLTGEISVPGYTATLLISAFFSSINMLSFGIIGLYIWRTFENTKNRPNTIIMEKIKFY